MSPAAAGYAVVSLPALDLRPQPEHRAELASQLLLGEIVRIESRTPRRGWRRVRNEADGYEGWVREWGLVHATAQRARRWRRAARLRVSTPVVSGIARPGGAVAVCPLFLGSSLIPGRRSGTVREVELPDGRRAWVPASALRIEDEPTISLADRLMSLLGVPYLWGGRTPAGIDCSALVQVVLAEQGVMLPRDARDQHAVCRPLPADAAPDIGDLAFFAARGQGIGHVGLSLGGGYFAHSRGWVRIAHAESNNVLCDKELVPQFVGWFRPPGRPTGRPGQARVGRFRA